MNFKSELPYYAVIFTSKRKMDEPGYNEMAQKMDQLSSEQPGFLGMQSAREESGQGITVSYWRTQEDILNWKKQSDHREAQTKGKSMWYANYEVRICKVEREYNFKL